jgi:hypothetical protein
MVATMLPPSGDTIRKVRSTTSVVYAEGARTVVALRGETDISVRLTPHDVVTHHRPARRR